MGTTDAQTDLLKLEYKYNTNGNTDNNGSLLEQKITVPTAGGSSGFTATQTYAYDSLNRLGSATETISGSQTWKQTFSIDRYGNRRFNTDNNNTTTLGSCSTAVCNPTINTSNNRFSSGQGYSYDANGNLTVDAEGKQFSYDAENHQKEVKDQYNASLGTYLYDGEGQRVKKISNTEATIFVYNAGGKLVAEYSTAPAQTPQVSYLTADHLGSPRVITDQNGAITTRKDYAAFGDETLTSQRTSNLKYDSSETRKGYTGYEKDSESGLDYAQARYYNSIHARFTSIDPLTASADTKNPQTFNRYSYVLNSPYKFTDPLGLISRSTGAYGNDGPGGEAVNTIGGGGAFGIGLFSDNGQVIEIGIAQDTARDAPKQSDEPVNAHTVHQCGDCSAQAAKPPEPVFRVDISTYDAFLGEVVDGSYNEFRANIAKLFLEGFVDPDTRQFLPADDFEFTVTFNGNTEEFTNRSEMLGNPKRFDVQNLTWKEDEPRPPFVQALNPAAPQSWEGKITVIGGGFKSIYDFNVSVSRVQGGSLTDTQTLSSPNSQQIRNAKGIPSNPTPPRQGSFPKYTPDALSSGKKL